MTHGPWPMACCLGHRIRDHPTTLLTTRVLWSSSSCFLSFDVAVSCQFAHRLSPPSSDYLSAASTQSPSSTIQYQHPFLSVAYSSAAARDLFFQPTITITTLDEARSSKHEARSTTGSELRRIVSVSPRRPRLVTATCSFQDSLIAALSGLRYSKVSTASRCLAIHPSPLYGSRQLPVRRSQNFFLSAHCSSFTQTDSTTPTDSSSP